MIIYYNPVHLNNFTLPCDFQCKMFLKEVSQRLQKFSKNRNIVKYYYNLKEMVFYLNRF